MTANIKVVISPGAFLLPGFYDEFRKTLRDSHGIDSIAVKHPSANAEAAETITLQKDVENMHHVILHILDNEKKDVVLFTHSYGGIVGSSACEGLSKAARGENKTGVVRVIYCTAFAFEKGRSLQEAMSQEARNPDLKLDTNSQRVYFDFKNRQFSDIKPEVLEPCSAYTAAPVWGGKASFDPSGNGILTTYIVTKRDTLVSWAKQEEMRDRIKPDSMYHLEADHYPTISCKEEVAAIVAEVVRK